MATYTGELGEKATRGLGHRYRHQDKWVFALLVFFMAFSVVAIWFGQKTGIGVVKVEASSPVAVRDIIMTHGDNSTVVVLDARDRSVIATFGAGERGFVPGSLRAFDRMRLTAEASKEAPYRVIRWEHGAVSLTDSVTGQRHYLDAFGADNAAAFAALLEGYGE